ncbi:MAG TPA: transcription-repair coupling factor, partial [Firmicutes bacterium]|nr:transcription-repair coupling factor [Bacillota bacterium]
GGNEWQKVKQRVNASVQEMAEELIELYAARESLRGHAFSQDDDFQKQFEDEFPYQETPDQLRAIEEVKKDMMRAQPMERLLCGDVGYGKTEVAIRAAFKAVSDGKQVAILVPTTILGMQHYTTFKERFRNYPFNIRLLSRFQSQKQNNETLRKVASGGVDIVIGTHRLLSKDVKFKDLGLVIVDEEQRFGVAQKERLKYLKKNVDVLTMTATPIPRTLHMALVGVRDMSLIETPPEDRYPVRTYVTEYNPETVRESILRELARNGQVYFVYNRVQGIDDMAAKIQKLVPEARIAVAHGQMDEKYLERVMVQFLEREYDILVCTTIIETGLDISNVNTLIVYDADHLGLSQLYQLRGRVGRTNRVAYAYFTYRPNKVLNQDAQKRLGAIRDFTELGSGFKLAMRDLEIRGAGNILGPEQHGFIAAVGFELYCQMLEEAVAARRDRSTDELESFEPQINITLDGYLPNRYIENEGQKIEMYKKINSVVDLESLEKIEDELIDRFGDLPQEAENLLWFSRIKLFAFALLIEEITEQKEMGREKTSLIIRFRKDAPLDGNKIQKAWEKYRNQIGFVHAKTPQLKLHKWDPKSKESRKLLLNLLEILAEQ